MICTVLFKNVSLKKIFIYTKSSRGFRLLWVMAKEVQIQFGKVVAKVKKTFKKHHHLWVKHKFEKKYSPDIVTVGYPSGCLDNGLMLCKLYYCKYEEQIRDNINCLCWTPMKL